MNKEVAKSYLKSRTFWGAVLVVVSGVVVAMGYTDFAAVIGSIGGALGLVGIRNAEGKLVWKE
jgi:hypothetical protein